LSESEFIESINLHAGNAITSLTVLLTYVFGFITAAYIVGSKLSKAQVQIISTLYNFSSFVWIVSALTHSDSFVTLVAAHPSYVPSRLWLLPWLVLTGFIGVSALATSLYFMYDVRSENAHSNTSQVKAARALCAGTA
jgi:hypothetical protein